MASFQPETLTKIWELGAKFTPRLLERRLVERLNPVASANVRQLKLRASPSILAGRIFDDRGNRMTPTHTNKNGARYRYYISHALLQKRNDETASLMRVPAQEIEEAVTKALRDRVNDSGVDERSSITDRELVERLVDRIIITSQLIEIQLRPEEAGASKSAIATVLKVRWKGTEVSNAKGILHSPLAPADDCRQPRCSSHRHRQGSRLDRRSRRRSGRLRCRNR
jgi:site-specific DNA recombinase